ncbi:MAG: lipopolysaccharide biosynthesis protein [Rhodospirillales bacterium]|nr:MAG: lipopolysaccharide biosynthesis protein [Rhodospirillales bacterium]
MDSTLSTPQDYIDVLKRRKWYIIVPSALLAIATALVAFLLPPVYRSSATILIEQPDVPPSLVSSTIASYVDERLQIIHRRATSGDNLRSVIQRFNLYPDQRRRVLLTDVVADMRRDIRMNLIRANVRGDGPRGQVATIAFEVSFDYGNPVTARNVLNELVSFYLSENVRARTEQAAEATAFLTAEASRLEREIQRLDDEIVAFKERHAGTLPEQLARNLQAMSRIESELRSLQQREDSLKQSKAFLEVQASMSNPYLSQADGGMSLSQRLEDLRVEFHTLSARYRSEHPTLIQLREEIAALEQAVGGGSELASLLTERNRLQSDLNVARQRLTDQHPDVIALRDQLEGTLSRLAAVERQSGRTRDGVPADNPAYIQLQMQLEGLEAELNSIQLQRDDLKQQMDEYEQRIAQTPVVEREWVRLQRAHDNMTRDFQSVRQRQIMAELGETLETERKSERFSLIEPANLPTEPIKPKRLFILAAGLILSVGVGLGIAILVEASDRSVHGPRQLAAVVGAAPLVTIPYIRTRREIRRLWQRRIGVSVASLGAVAGLLVTVHVYVMPWDVLWARFERQVEARVAPIVGPVGAADTR